MVGAILLLCSCADPVCPGWQLRISHSLVSVLNRIARARPFFRIQRFAIVIPARFVSSVKVIPDVSSSSSRWISMVTWGYRGFLFRR